MSGSFPDLLYLIAHNAPGGVSALASRMDKNATVLQHKLNPNNTTHFINAPEIETMLDFLNANDQAAHFFAEKCNKLLIDKMVIDGSDMQLLDGFMEVVRELGEFSSEFQKAFADGHIDSKEFKRIAKEGNDVMAKMAGLMDRIHQLVDEQPRLNSLK